MQFIVYCHVYKSDLMSYGIAAISSLEILCLILLQEIAIVCFVASGDENDHEGYDQLFKYLVERSRCAVFGSIGESIKDMYIWPLARKSSVPSILLPFTGPGVTRCISSARIYYIYYIYIIEF